ncbi:MAG: hypothetical protein ACRC1P_01580 [Cellulosilyticaceae bacterium]
MKKLLKMSLILTLGLSLIGCSANAKTEDITDTQTITQMDTLIKEKVSTYFNVTIPTDLTYEYNAFKRFIPSQEEPKTDVHHANIFQAAYKTKDPVEGQLLGYGGVLTPDNTDITGLIINIAPAEEAEPMKLAETDLIATATTFLNESGLVPADEELTYLEINQKGSSGSVTILNFETTTQMYAVGIDLFSGKAVYFEHVVKVEPKEAVTE